VYECKSASGRKWRKRVPFWYSRLNTGVLTNTATVVSVILVLTPLALSMSATTNSSWNGSSSIISGCFIDYIPECLVDYIPECLVDYIPECLVIYTMECLVDLASKSSGVAASSFSQNFDAVISDYFTTPSATPSATSSGTSSATSSGTSSKSSSLQQKFCSLLTFRLRGFGPRFSPRWQQSKAELRQKNI